MTKVQACVQSHLGDYRPTCYKLGLYLCASCVHSLAIYRLTSNFQTFKEKFEKFKLQSHAARQAGMTHTGMESGLAMTRTTLWAEFRELVLQLNDIEQTNSALYARLMTEARMRLALIVEATSTDMARHCPPSPHIWLPSPYHFYNTCFILLTNYFPPTSHTYAYTYNPNLISYQLYDKKLDRYFCHLSL